MVHYYTDQMIIFIIILNILNRHTRRNREVEVNKEKKGISIIFTLHVGSQTDTEILEDKHHREAPEMKGCDTAELRQKDSKCTLFVLKRTCIYHSCDINDSASHHLQNTPPPHPTQ